ncbi:hypothetical protein NQ314_001190 [Rhamnusium bicolor]|uniref:DDE Tnp4 domain-containing protein n=1 Tax=Rhamnusium bicolor TaxID=1586634 RepID=A0AAV8ZVZ4_9CUCU|nr:hypothetical protein NQ314_001190 [Rhamnusium bicolor]
MDQKTLNTERRIFNYRLSRARRIIENVFGILVARFRIFHTPINLKLKNTEKVVMACCVLHNFLRRKRIEYHMPLATLDQENFETGETVMGLRPGEHSLLNLERGQNRRAAQMAKNVRDTYMNYFNNEGSVPWQEQFI